MDILSKFSLPLVLFLATVGFGFWLSKVGKPYNGALFNIHKLVALGAVVFAVLQISKTGVAGSPLLVAMFVVLVLCVVTLFASGASMSIGKLDQDAMLTIHRVGLALAILAIGAASYLLAAKIN